MPLVGNPAPQFKGTAVVGYDFKEISLSDYKGKYVVLFYYPLDFTFVCPTEIIAFSDAAAKFKEIGCEVIGASCDSQFTHLAWMNTPRKEGGIGMLDIPLLADFDKSIATQFDCLTHGGVPLRAAYIIDGNGVVRSAIINDLPVGRNVDEVLRLVKAFQFTDVHGEVCPANWNEGQATMKADPAGSKEYFSAQNK